MRDRLIEILDDFGDDVSLCDVCDRPTNDCEGCKNEQLADYLLEKGIIVAPMPMTKELKEELEQYVYKRCVDEL